MLSLLAVACAAATFLAAAVPTHYFGGGGVHRSTPIIGQPALESLGVECDSIPYDGLFWQVAAVGA